MSNPVLWSMICLGAAALLFFVEILIPSGGLLGVLAAAAAIAGIVLLFQVNTFVGLIGAIIGVSGLPFLVLFSLRIWPDTPIARMLTLKNPEPAPDSAAGDPLALSDVAVGDEGKAISDLRPVGICVIGKHRLDCLAEGGIIRAGAAVRVVAVDGMQIKVRQVED
ncbi:MAG: hypothetical protein NTW19_16160 [Planctomycetota bacterium]|nr:hypothetical protein [Planctomycetota bacterium]